LALPTRRMMSSMSYVAGGSCNAIAVIVLPPVYLLLLAQFL
jgi:hypothetical protein